MEINKIESVTKYTSKFTEIFFTPSEVKKTVDKLNFKFNNFKEKSTSHPLTEQGYIDFMHDKFNNYTINRAMQMLITSFDISSYLDNKELLDAKIRYELGLYKSFIYKTWNIKGNEAVKVKE